MTKKENYHCALVFKDYVVKSFYREGESAQDVLEGLELFQWPRGVWHITPEGGPDIDY